MRALAADRQALAVAEPAIAGEVHQSLDVHRRLAAEVAFDLVAAIDRFADLQHFLVGKVLDPPFRSDAELVGDLLGLGAADSVDVGERDFDALVGRDVNAGDSSQSSSFMSSTGAQSVAGRRPISSLQAPHQTKNRRAHECAAGNRLIGMEAR
jgi:hypothetical protein